MGSVGDMMQICRLCLVKDEVNVPIFEEQGDIRQIFLKISSCLPVKVTRDDKLPKKICDGCSDKLDLLYEFWNTSANAEKQLLSWLDQAGMNANPKRTDATMSAVAAQVTNKPTEAVVKEEAVDLTERLDGQENVEPHIEDHDFYPENFNADEASAAAGLSATVTTADEEEPPPKRTKRAAALRALPITTETDEDEDDNFEPLTKIEGESGDEDEGEDADPSFADVPSTSAEDQPGPSGVGKGTVEAPLNGEAFDVEPYQLSDHKYALLHTEWDDSSIVDAKEEYARLVAEHSALKRRKYTRTHIYYQELWDGTITLQQQTQKKFSCNECSYKGDSEEELAGHIRFCHIQGNNDIVGGFNLVNPITPGVALAKCCFCFFKCFSKYSLIKHQKLCHPYEREERLNKKLSCNKCSYVTDYKKRLICHEKFCHDSVNNENPVGNEFFKCGLCFYKCYKKPSLAKHQRLCHPHRGACTDQGRADQGSKDQGLKDPPSNLKEVKDKFPCSKCSYEGYSKEGLTSHVRFCHEPESSDAEGLNQDHPKTPGVELVKCCFCFFKCYSKFALIKHQKLCHPCELEERSNNLKQSRNKMSCNKCSYESYYQERMTLHDRLCHDPENSKTAENLDPSLFLKSPGGDDLVKCWLCFYKCYSKHKLAKHQELCHPHEEKRTRQGQPDEINNLNEVQDSFPCTKCSYEGYSKEGLANHIKLCHEPENIELTDKLARVYTGILESDNEPFKCWLCFYKSYSTHNLRKHKEVCHPSSKTKAKLEQNNSNHHLYLCEICGQLLTKQSVQRHSSSHSEQRPFSCDYCSKKFKIKKHLERHELVHLDDCTKYECDVCRKAFKRKYTLTVHKRSHEKLKPFECDYCKKTFTTKQWRDTHRKRHMSAKGYENFDAIKMA